VDSGSAYLFDLQGNLIDTLDNPSPDAGDNFGLAISIGGDVVLVGSKDDAIGGGQKGTTYVFTAGPPPFNVTLAADTVHENLSPGTIVGSLSTDAPENGPYTFELVGGSGSDDNTLFTILGNELRTTSSFDFETRNTLNILVRATSAGGLISQRSLAITVADVNETPTDLIIGNTSIAEMNRVNDVIGTFSTIDPDANDSFTYSLISGDGDQDNAVFAMSGDQLLAAQRFDYESKRNYSVRIRSTDSGGLGVERTFSINITDVNPPAPESLPTYDLRPVIDLNGTAISSNPSEAIEIDGTVFFTATTPETGTELWRTDGTQNGTALVSDLVEGVESSSPARLAALNGKVIYFADYSYVDPGAPPGGPVEKRLGLFTTSADTGETERIYSFDGGPSDLIANQPTLFHFTRVGTELFFLTPDEFGTDKILWKTDGTSGGTNPIKTLVSSGGVPGLPGGPGSPGGGTDPIPTAVLGDVLLFNIDVNTADGSHALWRSDGTEAGTYILRAGEMGFLPGFHSLEPSIEVVGTSAYFVSNSMNEGKELWVTDGASASLVKDIFVGPDDSGPRSLISHNGDLYFIADDGTTGSELWVSDGTESGTRPVKDIAPGFGSGVESPLISWNGHLYFAGNDDIHGYELWRSDGTEDGTQMVVDAVAGFGSLLPQNFVLLDDRLLFSPSSFSGLAGQLWSTDGTA
ncbi:MAG: hypothetical protein KDA89_24215, partial [Planctomycetaceae bacterium]|nr:hypothetical protein [Planctomycetaceae bacterium]